MRKLIRLLVMALMLIAVAGWAQKQVAHPWDQDGSAWNRMSLKQKEDVLCELLRPIPSYQNIVNDFQDYPHDSMEWKLADAAIYEVQQSLDLYYSLSGPRGEERRKKPIWLAYHLVRGESVLTPHGWERP